jgi:hypothetical protein
MTYSELFSKRYSLTPTPKGLIHEVVPTTARNGFCSLIVECTNFFKDKYQFDQRYQKLYFDICKSLRVLPSTEEPKLSHKEELYHNKLNELLAKCEWWQFYDICEIILGFLINDNRRESFSKRINILFKEEHLGYELRNGKIEKISSVYIDTKIQETRYLLKEPEFKGADQHFEKAIKALNVRPKPDVENCVKDAVAAIESVGRIIIGDEKALLSDIIKDMVAKGIIPKPLDQVIQKIYAYRGDQPGVAHGLVGASKVTVDEAEFVLAMSAVIIIYLVKKRSKV